MENRLATSTGHFYLFLLTARDISCALDITDHFHFLIKGNKLAGSNLPALGLG